MLYSIFSYQNLEKLNHKKVIVFGCTANAVDFTMRLLFEEIKFDYFLQPYGEENYKLPQLYNKPILSINECQKMNDYVIICSFMDLERAKTILGNYDLLSQLIVIERLHPYIEKSSHVVIYGMGKRAKNLLVKYRKILNISAFVDSFSEKTNSLFEGYPIISLQELAEWKQEVTVIIASNYYKEIEKILTNKIGIAMDHLLGMFEGGLRLKENISFLCPDWSLKDILLAAKNRELFLYGNENVVTSLERKLLLLDVKVQKLLRKSIEEDGTIFDLAYQELDNRLLLLTDGYKEERLLAIKEIGIPEENIIWPEDYSLFRSCAEKYMLDPMLGVTPVNEGEFNSDYYGFKEFRFENGNKAPIVILTLGGSTTAAYFVREKTWSEKLSQLLTKENISHVIYCGGMHGYTASGELLKLIRDGIWLKPDIVLSYSGINNLHQEVTSYREQKFMNQYLGNLYDTIFYPLVSKKGERNISGWYCGINPDIGRFEYWFSQVEMIHAICNAFRIKCKVFLQPMLLSKTTYCKEDAEVIVKLGAFWNQNDGKYEYVNQMQEYEQWNTENSSAWKSIIEHAHEFREKGSKTTTEWLVNLSDLFDDITGAYMDEAHVYEWGNEIIAERILKEIKYWL